jgi:hypothetical protein
MARRSSKKVRHNNLPQRMLRKLEKKKRSGNPKRDGTDWTDNLIKEIKKLKEEK